MWEIMPRLRTPLYSILVISSCQQRKRPEASHQRTLSASRVPRGEALFLRFEVGDQVLQVLDVDFHAEVLDHNAGRIAWHDISIGVNNALRNIFLCRFPCVGGILEADSSNACERTCGDRPGNAQHMTACAPKHGILLCTQGCVATRKLPGLVEFLNIGGQPNSLAARIGFYATGAG